MHYQNKNYLNKNTLFVHKNAFSNEFLQMDINELIIEEDEDYVFINKPSGLLSIPDRFNKNLPNLYSMLKEKYGNIYIIHRLDKDTSGIICFGKNKDAHRDLNIKFDKGEVKKTYIALVEGKFSEKNGIINLPIAQSKIKKGKMMIDKKYGKESITRYEIKEEFKDYSLLFIKPETGRTHQIRVHLSAIFHPVVMDTIYNQNPKPIFLSDIKPDYKVKQDVKEKPILERLALHSEKLEFFHYKKQKKILVSAKLHKDFEITLKYLRKYGN